MTYPWRMEPWQYPTACAEFEADPEVLYWCVTCGFAVTKHDDIAKWSAPERTP